MEKFSTKKIGHWNSKKKQVKTFSGILEDSSSKKFLPLQKPSSADIYSDSSWEGERCRPALNFLPCSGESGKWKMIHMYQARNKRREQRLKRDKSKSSGKKKKSKGKKKAYSSSSSSSDGYSKRRRKKSTPKKKKKAGKKKNKSKEQ